jgi:hypothetical protein
MIIYHRHQKSFWSGQGRLDSLTTPLYVAPETLDNFDVPENDDNNKVH